MRTQALQYLYLQKPVTMVVVLCIISLLPWMLFSEFTTIGEPREACVATAILENGNWVLPEVQQGEPVYQPPMSHWLIALFSYPQGYVSEFTSQLPSALAYIILMGFVLFFFGERIKFQEAFIATLLLVTSLKIHLASLHTQPDMLLTAFMVIGLFQMYRWENKLELKGLPVQIPILLGCAILTRGPVCLLLPLIIFLVYLFVLNKYTIVEIIRSLVYVGISSLFLPLVWYIAAWQQGGSNFLDSIPGVSFGNFFETDNPVMGIVTLLIGFLPWTLFFIFSLFGMSWKIPAHSFKEILKKSQNTIFSMEKIKLFSLITAVSILVLFIFFDKKGMYLMSAYPFLAIFLAQYVIYLTEYRTKVTRVFAGFLSIVIILTLVTIGLIYIGVLNTGDIFAGFSLSSEAHLLIENIQANITSAGIMIFLIVLINLVALGTVFYQMSKKINIKILYSTIFLIFTLNLLIDSIVVV